MKLFGRTPAASSVPMRQRTKDLLSVLNLHIAGLSVLGLLNLGLLVQTVVLYRQAKGTDAEAIARQEVALKTARIAAQPLEGLDVKLQRASGDADAFYVTRLPVSYSEVAQELGNLSKKTGVRLAGAQYTQTGVTGDAAGLLTQVTLDARLTGGYRPLVLFINGLERDRVFFLINAVTLTGQQSGTVNLRVRITTYIRGMASEAEMQRVAVIDTGADAGAAQEKGAR